MSFWRRRHAAADRRAASPEERSRWEQLRQDREAALARIAYIETQARVLARMVARETARENK